MPTSSPNGLDAVIFDVDGTLVDSERDGHLVAFNEAFEAAGLPHRWDPVEYGDLLKIAGGRARLEAWLLDNGHDERQAASLAADLHADKTERFVRMVEEGRVPPRPGVHRLLRELRDADITLAVATTGSRAWVAPLLQREFSDIPFVAVITSDEEPRRKPDPAAYLRALEELGTGPGRTLVIEDAEKGLVAARGAGLDCLVVVNDYTRGEDFDGALLVVDSFGHDQPAAVLAGDGELLDDGRVTMRTCARLRA